jgi:DNA-binding response OmpR family regulator
MAQSEEKIHRILVADCDTKLISHISNIIEIFGYKAVQAKNGREAYRILQREPNFALCIIEANLPEFDGLSLVQFMRADQTLREVPVIMIGSEGSVKAQSISFNFGELVFLPKPFKNSQLQTMIGLLINRHQSRSKNYNYSYRLAYGT